MRNWRAIGERLWPPSTRPKRGKMCKSSRVLPIATALSIVALRSTSLVWFSIGAMLAGVASKVLKSVLRQPRPEGARRRGHGMPSSHATVMSFYAVHGSLYLLGLLGAPAGWRTPWPVGSGGGATRATSTPSLLDVLLTRGTAPAWLRAHAPLAVLLWGACVAYLAYEMHARTYEQRHTRAQVLVGAVVGSAVGVGWMIVTHALRMYE